MAYNSFSRSTLDSLTEEQWLIYNLPVRDNAHIKKDPLT